MYIDCVRDARTAISLYMVEPAVCKYILVVESGMFCDIMDRVDQYGLFIQEDDAFDNEVRQLIIGSLFLHICPSDK